MIQIHRNQKENKIAYLPSVKKNRIALSKFFKENKSTRRQHKPPFVTIPRKDLDMMLDTLLREFNGKCAYCEQRISTRHRGNIDHFRPKYAASGYKEKDFSIDHYWPLAYDWRNMYLCCPTCNKYKSNLFPVQGLRTKLPNDYEEIIRTENNLIIDPCRDDPESAFAYQTTGKMIPLNESAKITIDILKLNRRELVTLRRKCHLQLSEMYAEISGAAIKNLSPKGLNNLERENVLIFLDRLYFITNGQTKEEFAGLQHYYLKRWLLLNENVVQLLKNFDKTKQLGAYFLNIKKQEKKKGSGRKAIRKIPDLNRFDIESIEIENFKSIEKLHVVFPTSMETQESWLMLLGENGMGKSSFLHAVSLAMMGDTYRKKINLKSKDLLRHGTKSGFVRIHQTDGNPIELTFNEKTIRNSTKTPAGFLIAYGSTRLFPSKNIKPELTTGPVRAKNMFSPEVALFADKWLIDLHSRSRKDFDYAARALIQLLASEFNDPEIRLSVRNGDVFLNYSVPGKTADRLRNLSDGYKSVIAIACDMMHALMKGNVTMETANGVVLIDEIGTHLHPRWKMRVVKSLRTTFPKMQFICTTHDPLCLKGLRAGEVAVFSKNAAGQIYSITNLPNPAEFTADQLLSSRFFGLNSTIDEDLEIQFNEYYMLLGKKDKTNTREKKKLEKLKIELKGKQHLGQSLREEMALTAADELLAEELQAEQSTPAPELMKKTVQRLQQMWDKAEMV